MSARDETIAQRLLPWYDRHARDLPWRSLPGQGPPDPYAVWLSEVMLQQTTVAAVKPYFSRFTERWPSVHALAAAQEAEVMAAWAGLGYYPRARNLLKAAREVVRLGRFPDNEAELRKLPGVGAYTAAAVAAIAFGKRAVVVDANVERVLARLHAIADPLPGARKTIRLAAERATPDERAGDFAQAMMDLGATICTPRAPRCMLCPLSESCAARASGVPEAFPAKAGRRAVPERRGKAYWIERDGCVWLVRRPANAMLGGMRGLPDDGWSAQSDGSAAPPMPGQWALLGEVRHVFTHARLALEVFAGTGNAEPPDAGEWWPVAKMDEAGLPTLFAKAARLALARPMPAR